MSWDPQNAPLDYVHAVRRLTDTDGVELMLYVDQDGDEWVMTMDEWRDGPRPMTGTWSRTDEPHTCDGCGAPAVATRSHRHVIHEYVCDLHLLARGWLFDRATDLHPRLTRDEEEPDRRALLDALRSGAWEDGRLPSETPTTDRSDIA